MKKLLAIFILLLITVGLFISLYLMSPFIFYIFWLVLTISFIVTWCICELAGLNN